MFDNDERFLIWGKNIFLRNVVMCFILTQYCKIIFVVVTFELHCLCTFGILT